MLRSSAMKHDLQSIRKALTMLVTFSGSVPVFKCYRGHTTVMSGVAYNDAMKTGSGRPSRPPSPFPLPFQIMIG